MAQERSSQLLGILLRCLYQLVSVTFVAVPFVQLGDDLLHCLDHVLEIPLSAATNAVSAFKRDYVVMPVGAFSARRRSYSPDRYDFVDLFHHSVPGEQIGTGTGRLLHRVGVSTPVCIETRPLQIEQ